MKAVHILTIISQTDDLGTKENQKDKLSYVSIPLSFLNYVSSHHGSQTCEDGVQMIKL